MALPRQFLAGAMLTIATLAATSACTNPSADDRRTTAVATKHGSGELRTDTEPLSARFARLGSAFQARWMSGTVGDPENPGPSTYWLDAVIDLPPDTVIELVSAYAPTATGEVPAVAEGLRPHVPPGPFQASAALDAAFTQDRWHADAYLDPASGVLVLVALGT